MKLKWNRRVARHPVGQIATIEGQRLGIIDFGTALSRDLRKEIDTNILTHGEPFGTGGILGPACLPVVGAGSTIVSSLFAGNLFLATANPATLMPVGAGVTASVIGAGSKIVATAPFIAAGTAIIPVVVPVMFFMVLSSMMMSVRFDQIQTSLVQLAQAIEVLLKREITGDYGILMSALERLEDISEEFSESKRFTEEMKVRMAIVERDVNVLHHKYNFLSKEPVNSKLSARLKATEIDLFVTSSLADIQVDGLRLKLALQDNPDDVPRSFSTLNAKIDRYESHFRQLLENDSVKRYQSQMQESVDSMGWWKRNVFLRKQRRTREAEIKEIQSVRDEKLELARMNIARWTDNIASGQDTGPSQSVLYYREHSGKGDLRAYYTSDWQFLPEHFAQSSQE